MLKNLYKNRKENKFNEIKQYENEIMDMLGMSVKVPIIYGKQAKEFIEEYTEYDKKKIAYIKGVYIMDVPVPNQKTLPSEYRGTGVICLVTPDVTILAHEMCHAKQFQEENDWLLLDELKYSYYTNRYPYYPVEEEAFKFGIKVSYEQGKFLESFLYSLSYKGIKLSYNLNVIKLVKWLKIKRKFKELGKPLK